MGLHMVPFCNHIKMISACKPLGVQTGVAADQTEGRTRGLLKFCYNLKYSELCLKPHFGATASTQLYLSI